MLYLYLLPFTLLIAAPAATDTLGLYRESPTSITVDFESNRRDLCRVDFEAVLIGQQAYFLDADRYQTNPEAPVACNARYDGTLIPPADCPSCNTVLTCIWEDRFANAIPIFMALDGEIALDFYLHDTALIYGQSWEAYVWNGDKCDQRVSSGTMEPRLVALPEPGSLLLLAAGVPILWLLAPGKGKEK